MDLTPAPGSRRFETTRWTLVLAAGGADTAQARQALDDLCRIYWPPLYAFVRRRGHSVADAQDSTQEFFARLLERRDLVRVDPAKGRFRSYLLASMTHFLANEWDRARAQKRGGGAAHLSIDAGQAEAWYLREVADVLTPERVFERRWALSLLNDVLAGLQREYAAAGKDALFRELKGALSGEVPIANYAAVGARLGLSEGAVKVAAHRLRVRYRERLRTEVARTVEQPEEIDEELRFLLAAVGS